MSPSDRLEILKSICNKCHNCALGNTRKNLVFGEGPIVPTLMSVAESPGAEEDASGRPFQGRSGKFYRQLLQAIGLNPEKDVYMTNVVLCRPPNNRPPEDEEINECINFLKKQIEIIQPRIILLLGRTAVKGLFPEYAKTPLDRLRKDSKNNREKNDYKTGAVVLSVRGNIVQNNALYVIFLCLHIIFLTKVQFVALYS